MEIIQAYERLLDIPGKIILSDNISLIIQHFAFQPEARPNWPNLVFSLHSMYNSALPGEYLELSLPTLPTPPSSTENSSGQFVPMQVTKQARQMNNEYLTPKVPGELSSTNPGSGPKNSNLAVTSTYGSMTTHKINLLTNRRSNGSDTIGQYTTCREMPVNDRPKLSLDFDVPPNEICESLPLTHQTNILCVKAQRSYSETAYKASPSEIYFGKTCSSESGYGTTRYSMGSDQDRACCKCGNAEVEDEVFYLEEEEV
jgi:hypothetical protein